MIEIGNAESLQDMQLLAATDAQDLTMPKAQRESAFGGIRYLSSPQIGGSNTVRVADREKINEKRKMANALNVVNAGGDPASHFYNKTSAFRRRRLRATCRNLKMAKDAQGWSKRS